MSSVCKKCGGRRELRERQASIFSNMNLSVIDDYYIDTEGYEWLLPGMPVCTGKKQLAR
jgi:hypothetical protein